MYTDAVYIEIRKLPTKKWEFFSALDAQGISCFRCPKSIYKLYPLSDACREEYISHILKGTVRFGMTVSCGEDKPVCTFELTLSPTEKDREGGARA